MTHRIETHSATTLPDEALRILTEAWSYYTPSPRIVTERSSQPSPVFEEYYAA
ncbi:hypothetical protein [Marivita sp. XM-24bin2]|jgi:hypothetical protein|uniref:hypothetical protein n=1 Tax=unclassified Marivita TaxID=2632480 RepID=UPI0025C606F9|nr:hypothetical protein [Marivita sp. XM-24bin2]MCR9109495.1 hypothetical protein [Paracoccaceae bacterium]